MATQSRNPREQLEFTLKGPVSICFDEEQMTSPGCAILDLIFNTSSQVGEIVLRNYYTSWLSVLVVIEKSQEKEESPVGKKFYHYHSFRSWQLAIAHKTLMPNPNLEIGSQNIISITAAESIVLWDRLLAIRLIMRQPSPMWQTFHVEDIKVFKDIPRRSKHVRESSTNNPESLLMLLQQKTLLAITNCSEERTDSSDTNQKIRYEFTNLPQL